MKTILTIFALSNLLFLTGCGKEDYFKKEAVEGVSALPGDGFISSPNDPETPLDENDLCEANPLSPACSVDPIAKKPSVATILLTLSQVEPNAAQLIAINIIRNVSPVMNPKILFLEDSNLFNEDPQDVQYVNMLLAGLNVTYKKIGNNGLEATDLVGYDVAWIINPGFPLQNVSQAMSVLNSFEGSIVLQGDDMAKDTESLTGLSYLNNGTSVSCNGQSHHFDNLHGNNYEISMLEEFLPGIPTNSTFSLYGNDIDHVQALSGTKVLALARAPASLCPDFQTPAIVVRER